MVAEFEKKVCIVDRSGQTLFCVGSKDFEKFFDAMKNFYGKDIVAHAIRNAIRAELDAINQYEALARIAEEADEPEIAYVARDIADEERKHVGEFLHLLRLLSVRERKLIEEGMDEGATKVLDYYASKKE